jgi:hypothetical protein
LRGEIVFSIYILSSSAIARILPRVFLLENLSSKKNW